MARNYGLDMYNQLEELMKKMDKMLIEIANLKMELKIEKEESIKKDNTIINRKISKRSRNNKQTSR